MNNEKLKLSTKISYGVGDMGANLLFNTVSFYLLYYLTDIALLSASLAGLIFTLVRIVDASVDPAIGYYSDRTKSRFGRRRPYVLYGSVPASLLFYLLFAGSPTGTQSGMFVYYLIIYAAFCVGYSIVNVPYSALTPDMTSDFNERTSLNGYRMSAAIVGTLIAAGATKPLVSLFPDEKSGFAIIAAVYALIFTGINLIVFFGSKERHAVMEEKKENLVELYLQVFRNKAFIIIAVTYILHTVAVTIISSMMVYYFKYYLKEELAVSLVFLALLLTSMACIPLWVALSKRIGKKASYMAGMSLLALAMLIIFFLGQNQILFVYILAVLAGLGLSTFYVLPWSMVPDTIEYNELQCGRRSEGIFYGVWSFGPNLGSSLAGVNIGLGLTISKYIPNEPMQTAGVLLGIRALLCLLPILLIVAGVIILSFYPITQKKYTQMIEEIKKASDAKLAKPANGLE